MTQSAALCRFVKFNSTGDAEYGEAVTFLCRFEYKRKEVLDSGGNRVISEAAIFTETELRPLDVVVFGGRQWTVKSAAPQCALTGEVDHWEVTL